MKKGRDKDTESDTSDELFERAMSDVVRLAPDPRGRARVASPVTAPRTTPAASQHDTPDDAGTKADFVAPGVDRREIRKLKRGDYTPANRLDLHGVTAAEAVASVKRFIEHYRHNPDTAGLKARTTSVRRCVCIVHGRGLHSEGHVAVLKTRVRECLRQHRSVLAYADAPRADGGAGAVYVLLRR